jgi:hypothetical protein
VKETLEGLDSGGWKIWELKLKIRRQEGNTSNREETASVVKETKALRGQ